MRDYAKLFAESFPRRGLAGISRFLTLYAERGALTPADLNGKRVGVRAYTQTTGAWVRGFLSDDYGIDPAKVHSIAVIVQNAVLRFAAGGNSAGVKAFRETTALLQLPDPPTALIAGGNQILVGVLKAVQQVGIEVPKQLSLITCDRTDLATTYPGPLTVIVPASKALPDNLTAGTNTIGLRWPVATFATRLVEQFGKPVTATSANRSGMAAAVTVEEVQSQIGDSVEVLIDGGRLPSRSGSTLLDLTADPPVLLREGPVTFESLDDFFKGRLRRQVA